MNQAYVNFFINSAIILSYGLHVNIFYTFVNNKQLWSSSQPVICHLLSLFSAVFAFCFQLPYRSHTQPLFITYVPFLLHVVFLRPWVDWIILPLQCTFKQTQNLFKSSSRWTLDQWLQMTGKFNVTATIP